MHADDRFADASDRPTEAGTVSQVCERFVGVHKSPVVRRIAQELDIASVKLSDRRLENLVAKLKQEVDALYAAGGRLRLFQTAWDSLGQLQVLPGAS